MFDWLASMEVQEQAPLKAVLRISSSTRVVGVMLLVAAGYAFLQSWEVSPWLAFVPALVSALALVMATLERQITVDREAGVLKVKQRAIGLGSETVVPLFHLRAVVIVAKPGTIAATRGIFSFGSRYIAYIDRRVGEPIYLDESRRCAQLLRLAEAISDVAEIRLEYEASPPDSASA